MTTYVWREKILDVATTRETGVIAYRTGQLRAGVVVRIPVWLESWLRKREKKRLRKLVETEDALVGW